jgi:hypothetical protein
MPKKSQASSLSLDSGRIASNSNKMVLCKERQVPTFLLTVVFGQKDIRIAGRLKKWLKRASFPRLQRCLIPSMPHTYALT